MAYNDYVTDFTKDGKCIQCGQCCSDVLPLSANDIKKIHAYIEKHNIQEQRNNVANVPYFTCPFRDDENKRCTIYPVRPQICRSFMCNHTHEDIMKAKLDFHKRYNVVYMRQEFFGNDEVKKYLEKYQLEVMKKHLQKTQCVL